MRNWDRYNSQPRRVTEEEARRLHERGRELKELTTSRLIGTSKVLSEKTALSARLRRAKITLPRVSILEQEDSDGE